MPSPRFRHFQSHIERARSTIGLGQSVASLTNGLIDASDLYRSAIVQAVAALDTYIHGIVIDMGVDIVFGRRTPGNRGKLGLPVGAIADILDSPDPIQQEIVVRSHIVERLSFETFQKPDDIGRALALVGIQKFWQTAFGNSAGDEKKALGVIVDRRNKIVHECDENLADPSYLNDLSDSDALSCIEVVTRQVRRFDEIISDS